jgi:ribosomal protein S18 acetylase RimI-like enzyme
MEWQPITPGDLQTVQEIGDFVHPHIPESFEVLREKYTLFPQGCYKLIRNNKTVGYGISHAWLIQVIPAVDVYLGVLPEHPDCIHVHDIGILPQARGEGAASAYMNIIKDLALSMGIKKLSAVSVYGTEILWGRLGFEVTKTAASLDTYGDSGKYLVWSFSS